LDEPQHELKKIELALDTLQARKIKPNGDVNLSHGYLTAKQYAPIQDWVGLVVNDHT
jgi:hypothetical protein